MLKNSYLTCTNRKRNLTSVIKNSTHACICSCLLSIFISEKDRFLQIYMYMYTCKNKMSGALCFIAQLS